MRFVLGSIVAVSLFILAGCATTTAASQAASQVAAAAAADVKGISTNTSQSGPLIATNGGKVVYTRVYPGITSYTVVGGTPMGK